ncbi:Chaperone DnaJ-domain superfamily protein [Striga hermonthica]|uniref:Chaperone DnaJ-domain superfamily protein n=1 Tax=Striga hermonthica TaxID=68872 RepID=A0A9N7NQG7_STRHE|nr:Chaperone DnaJ-domain superfamily protein [Striga hermonthica]
MEPTMETSRAEAERLLGIAEKLLRNKDYGGCRDFAILAQETEPLLEGSDQILAVAEVLLAADNKRLSINQPDWYAVLQIPQRTEEAEVIKKQYRRLALLLHPDKNRFPFSDSAFRLVADSWAVLSDPTKKSAYDSELVSRFTRVDLVAAKKQQFNQPKRQQQQEARGDNSHHKLPVRRSARGTGGASEGSTAAAADSGAGAGVKETASPNPRLAGNFWTACPYCYNLFEYPRVYEGCCVRCDNENCRRAFTATPTLSMPPMVPGSEAYYCCWGFFPMGFAGKGNELPKWMPPMFGDSEVTAAAPKPQAAPTHTPPPPPSTHTQPQAAPTHSPPPPPSTHTRPQAAPTHTPPPPSSTHTPPQAAPTHTPPPPTHTLPQPPQNAPPVAALRKRGRPRKDV